MSILLNLKMIRKYGFEERVYKPDWDDVAIDFILPNDIILHTLSVCNNEAVECDSLEGFDGFIDIETKEELDDLLKMSYEEVIEDIASKNADFDKEEYI